jgi:molybdopterin synthase catalytic subunit
MKIIVQTKDFDLSEEVYELHCKYTNIGAVVSFVGLVREFDEDATIQTLTLEHYPSMTEKSLQTIANEAKARWEIVDMTIIHRVGTLHPQEQIVMVAVASSHRQNAFNACEFVMDYLKTKAPFWKKTKTNQGEHWVDAKFTDEHAIKRWE